jgi:hypothetical protein
MTNITCQIFHQGEVSTKKKNCHIRNIPNVLHFLGLKEEIFLTNQLDLGISGEIVIMIK